MEHLNLKKLFCTFAILSFFSSYSTAAHSNDDDNPSIISVTGQAEIQVVPDEIEVSMTIEKQNKSIEEAQKQNDAIAESILRTMKVRLKIDDKDVQTNQISVRPVYTYPQCDNGRCNTPQFSHFETTKGIFVKLKDANKLQELLNEALSAGVTQINGVNFTSSKMEELQDKAQILATQDAKKRAEAITESIGVTIGKPHRITVNQSYRPSPIPQMEMRAMSMAADSGNSTIALGQITVSSQVNVDFEIK